MSTTKVPDALRDVTVVDAAKITTGTIPEARITTLASTKLTGTVADARFPATLPASSGANLTALPAANLTGTIADARIPASAVTQHVVATDLTSVRQDIAMLALYNAVSDNRAAYNLPFSFIDQFEDDTGLTTQTDVDRDATGEYVSSISFVTGSPSFQNGDRQSSITVTSSGLTLAQGNVTNLVDGGLGLNSTDSFYYTAHTPSAGAYIRFQFSTAQVLTLDKYYFDGSGSSMGTWQWQGSDNASAWTDIGSNFALTSAGTVTGTQLTGNATGYIYYQMAYVSGTVSDNHWHKEIEFTQASWTTTVSATGTLISDTQTSSVATTKMSGVILYKDNAGTATLGTDLKIYLSANGGTNYTEVVAADYGTVTPLFSTGVKMVRLAEQTVTSGTTPVMKAVWANQASGSKETQLHGWAMNY
jgi:hypothetical protein